MSHLLLALLIGAGPAKIALMPLSAGEGVDEKTAEALTQSVASELRHVPGAQILTGQELSAVLSVERQKQLVGCQTDACMAEVAGALDVDRIVLGSVARLGQSWLVHLTLVDARKAITVGSSDRRKKGGSIDDVLDALSGMVAELFPGATPSTPSPPAAAPQVNAAPVNAADHPIEADRAKLQLVRAPGGFELAFVPFSGLDGPLFYGIGKNFYAQRVFGGGSEGDKRFDVVFWEPRARAPAEASFHFRDGSYALTCGKREIPLRAVPPVSAQKALGDAKFFGPRWQRQGYALARDDEGTYYYVDQARESEENQDFHLYVGNQGRMSPVQVRVLASDRAGDVLAAPNGKLKLSRVQREAEWIEPGGAHRKLEYLPVEDHARFIYTQLGVYAGQSLGTPCDGLL